MSKNKAEFIEVGSVWESESGKSFTGGVSPLVRYALGLPKNARVMLTEVQSDHERAPDYKIQFFIPEDEEKASGGSRRKKRRRGNVKPEDQGDWQD